jgi:hypothetical protein
MYRVRERMSSQSEAAATGTNLQDAAGGPAPAAAAGGPPAAAAGGPPAAAPATGAATGANSNMSNNSIPITLDILIERTGRENGPDICLKVDDNVKRLLSDNNVITAQSNITEVLNVIAYFCNANINRTDANGINMDDSIDLTHSGLHEYTTGYYNTKNTGAGAHDNSLWKDDTNKTTTQMIDINNLKALAGIAANHIPVGILMRNGEGVAGTLKNTNKIEHNQRKIDAAGAGAIPDGTVLQKVFVNCIKQMINILEQTRTIFGPKGWANLYRKMNGGGSGGANKNHIKRTHRRHRRRYSSKQY